MAKVHYLKAAARSANLLVGGCPRETVSRSVAVLKYISYTAGRDDGDASDGLSLIVDTVIGALETVEQAERKDPGAA